ncbi:putative RNA-binding family protein [Tripterygium wilfordii]|uniref:Putative RNA-binding family protein n=1 Tax=Tripterygium wilfordii TaxID=458696 RepID=A0A7J7D0R8_TRIWF|nr:RNA-binding protein 1-like [Tripterygium wilfordii]KAF5739839.1 putative RNA-binding family protein [Tripterygium wilfordii]
MGSDQSGEAKLFVGGISRETTEGVLRDHFCKYGVVLNVHVAKDRSTGNRRGFGFVLFADASSLYKALQDPHVILGIMVDVNKARPRRDQHDSQQQQLQKHHQCQQQHEGLYKNCGLGISENNRRTKKVFVGGLAASLTEQQFRSYFERFGRIMDVVVMHDNLTNRPRGFGFVTFDSEESVENLMQQSFHELNGKLVEVKRAVPKLSVNSFNNGHNRKVDGGRSYSYPSSEPGSYLPYSHGYGIYTAHAPLPGYGGVGGYHYGTDIYAGMYPMVGYNRVGYGVTPVVATSPWTGPLVIESRAYQFSYSNACAYPFNMNGGVGNMFTLSGGFDGIVQPGVNWRTNQVLGSIEHLPADVTPAATMDGEEEHADSSGFNGNDSAVSS